MSMTIETKQKIFICSDLALVAAISIYHPIASIDKQNSRKALFTFIRTPELDDLVERFWQKKLLVEPQQYFDNLKSIKNRLYSNG